MELTTRDKRFLADIALHHVMTRDIAIQLGYFGSVPRANARLLALSRAGFLERIHLNPVTASRASLYRATKLVATHVGDQVASVILRRQPSNVQIDHSLGVLAVRAKLKELGMRTWRSEPECRHAYVWQGKRREEVRPDGLAVFQQGLVFIEVDRGTVALPRIKEKLRNYAIYVRSGMLQATYCAATCRLLFVTTSMRRQSQLERLSEKEPVVQVIVLTFDALLGVRQSEEVIGK